MVRAAVLKGKDPQQILEEMEKIDQMGKVTNIVLVPSMKQIFSQNLT